MPTLEQLLAQDNPNRGAVDALWHEALASYTDTLVVLDDDPTGTQTVHDISVYTDWEPETLCDAFAADDRAFFVLTNSRSFSAAKTEEVHREIAQNVAAAATAAGKDFTMVSRGDSTLRGHYPLEDEVLRATLTEMTGNAFDGEIICPAFFEGGRYTYGDVHYMRRDGKLIPVGETEFARDETFGYQASNLINYVVEKSNGAVRREDCISVSLDELRALDLDGITAKLTACHDFQKVIVNAVDATDLKAFTVCFMRARAAGKRFICRTAASFPQLLAGIESGELLTRADIEDADNANGGLVIMGSHVKLSTEQLECLRAAGLPLDFCEFDVNAADADGTFSTQTASVTAHVEEVLSQGRTAVVYTTRALLAPADLSPERKLALSVNISDGLTSIVSKLGIRPRYLIAKGGITSSDIATKGLGVRRARVLGQAAKGIPVWKTGAESRFPGMAYLIFPGNVGEPETLKNIVEELEG